MSKSRPSVFITYCEDIRHEKNGKHIFIGVYDDTIVAKQFPHKKNRLVMLARAYVPTSKPVKDVGIKVFMNGQVIGEQSHKVPTLDRPARQTKYDKNPLYLLNFEIIIKGIEFTCPAFINCEFRFDKIKLQTNGLYIQQSAPQSDPEKRDAAPPLKTKKAVKKQGAKKIA